MEALRLPSHDRFPSVSPLSVLNLAAGVLYGPDQLFIRCPRNLSPALAPAGSSVISLNVR